LREHALAVYSFANIYIWKDFFDIRWAVINKSLCVFFRDKIGCFLYLEPLGGPVQEETMQEIFQEADHIENVEEDSLGFYEKRALITKFKAHDYICRRSDLVNLSGNKFKSQRWGLNYFLKHYRAQCAPYTAKDKSGCLALYKTWMQERKSANSDSVYQWMLEDNFKALKTLLNNYSKLGVLGCSVKIDGEIKAFSFGYRLDKDTFCILYEITDLSVKGLAQFIFHHFCSQLKGYKFINIMDDSGLENLKKVKLSYHPVRLASAYIIKKKE